MKSMIKPVAVLALLCAGSVQAECPPDPGPGSAGPAAPGPKSADVASKLPWLTQASAGDALAKACFPVRDPACPKTICTNQPIDATMECWPVASGMSCDAYPVEVPDNNRLQYQWRVMTGGVTTLHPYSGAASIYFECLPGNTTSVRVTVKNGTATDMAFDINSCGGVID